MGLTGVRSGSKDKDSKSSSKRKLEKKLSFYNKVHNAIEKKSTKKKKLRSRQKKLKAYDLSGLSEFLPDLESLARTPTVKDEKINCKSRQALVKKEAARMQAVLKDPSFMKDPFEAIHKHLLATQPPMQEDNKSVSKGKKKEKKKRVKKAKSSTQDMEM
ncbi:hypothetical protein LUZ62_078951 [Rhynchospora pubera]|uniref:Ribosome biogenesis protein SLX9 n=1 Tax=Rhynchospora pubera TaxID=906938 RepID=A0AAV8DMY6_9POAL|nr:hypothetical protein LUZ62_078951 [Rhynchospora pubera]